MKPFSELSVNTKRMYTRAFEEVPGDKYNYDNVMKYSKTITVHKAKLLFKALLHFDETNRRRYSVILSEYTLQDEETKRSGITYSDNELKLISIFETVMSESSDTERYETIYNRMPSGTMEKVLVMFHLFHPLRSDYWSIKVRNFDVKRDNYYSKGVLYFNELVKVNRSLRVQLSEAECLVLHAYLDKLPDSQEYLLGFTNSGSYTQAVRRISTNVFCEKFSINKFRHLRDFPNAVKEIYGRLNDLANSMNHTLSTHVEKY
jgi:hypothetical protein